ncbi:MAG: M3 family oligoendopeptidase [Campylobacter sp.]|nr:M3 family oligoendopeptidase [Campylobacter sp.]
MNWNLTEFFKDKKEFDGFILLTKKSAMEFESNYKNRLVNLTSDEFYIALKEYENINKNIARVETYAYLTFAKDTSKGSFLVACEKIANEITKHILFFELEFGEIKDKAKFIKNSKEYAYYLSLIDKQKSHRLSQKEEGLLLNLSPLSSGYTRLFDESLGLMKFEFNSQICELEELLSHFSDEDRQNRKEASISLSKGLRANSHLLTFILNMIRADLEIKRDIRSYEKSEDIMHEYNQISRSSVDALIKATESSFGMVGKYYERKKELLGFDEIYDYDRYAPIGKSSQISYEEAKKVVLDSFYEFSSEFGNLAKKAMDENWIDVYPAKGKMSGAFSHSAVSDIHPFVMLNFTGKTRDAFTLAHELGHAIHQHLAYSVGYLNSNTPLTTAETASVFCEMLVFKNLVKNASKDEKITLLASKIEDIFATLYRQINFTTFERRIHSLKGDLQTEEIDEIWMEESKKMFDGKLKLNEYYSCWWGYISHFIHSPFYCYAYAYAQLLVLAIFGLYSSRKCENFVEIYTKFLSLGGSKSPKEMVGAFEFDIEDERFWQIGIDEIAKLCSEFDELTKS